MLAGNGIRKDSAQDKEVPSALRSVLPNKIGEEVRNSAGGNGRDGNEGTDGNRFADVLSEPEGLFYERGSRFRQDVRKGRYRVSLKTYTGNKPSDGVEDAPTEWGTYHT